MDFSDALSAAAQEYRAIPNLYFVQGDIADTGLLPGSVDFVCCDQVIMHTQDPDATFEHLASRVCPGGEFACYVYAQKALPRELLDDYFRIATHDIPSERLWEMSAQLTELGKRLSALNVSFDAPDIPELGIKGGKTDIQRFIYWNFLKCFWNSELGEEISVATNFDWYSPSNARRYSRTEFLDLVNASALKHVYFHEEEACYSGRFLRPIGGDDISV